MICSIGLVQPKHNENVGAVLRAAHAFGANSVAITGHRYKRVATDTCASFAMLPLLHYANLHDAIPFDTIPVAIELVDNAQSLKDYKHPKNAFYVFGPEDGTLGKETLSWCKDVVSIETAICLNLAACVNIVLYDRWSKS